MADLEIRDLHVRTEDREILRGVDLDINRGEIHALMGPNGSGKSTLANTLLGHPYYEITEGSIAFNGEDITVDVPPDVAILDETDSGLDIDALRTVAEGVQRLHDEQGLGALIITHYQRILHYVEPEFVHILMDGRIVLEGGVELVERLEREGYDQIRREFGGAGVDAERNT